MTPQPVLWSLQKLARKLLCAILSSVTDCLSYSIAFSSYHLLFEWLTFFLAHSCFALIFLKFSCAPVFL